MADNKPAQPKQPASGASAAHGQETSHHDHTPVGETAISRTTGTIGHEAVHTTLHTAEQQIVRVSAQVVERLAGTINAVLKTLPAQAAIAFEKAVESGKFGAGLLRHVPGVGVVASGAGATVEYVVARKLGEPQNDAMVNAITSFGLGVATTAAGVGMAPAAAILTAGCEVVREGLHAAGFPVSPSLLHQTVARHLQEFPKRLETEMSVEEARLALRDKGSEQYKSLVAGYKKDHVELLSKYPSGFIPSGIPATSEEYVSNKISKAMERINGMPGDMPSGLPKLGHAAGKRAELESTIEDGVVSPTAATQETSPPPASAAVSTAPAPSVTIISASNLPPVEPLSKDKLFASLLAANDFKVPAINCKVSETGVANLGCFTSQQSPVVEEQTASVQR